MWTLCKETSASSEWVEPSVDQIQQASDRILRELEHDELGDQILLVKFADQFDDPVEPRLEFLHQFWKSHQNPNTPVPLRTDFQMETLLPAVGNILILDPIDGGLDARYRLYGSGVSKDAGKDWTGHLVSEMNRSTRTSLALMYRSIYRAVWLSGRPIYSHHQSPPWLGVKSWLRLILPVSVDGAVCSQFIVGNIPMNPRRLSHEDQAKQSEILGKSAQETASI